MQQRVGVRAFASRPARVGCVRVHANSGLVNLVGDIQKDYMKKDLKTIAIGDTVRVGISVVEAKGKTRTQTLEGVIIADQGTGINKTVTFRRIFQGIGMELTLPVHAPVVQSMDVVRHGRIRRSKLYYLRDRVGKSAKLKEIVGAAAAKREAKTKAKAE
jgi:large subunit ribosomal protein L19